MPFNHCGSQNAGESGVNSRYASPVVPYGNANKSPALDFKAAARDIALYYRVGKAVANSREWPRWKPGTEFKAAREESDAARR